MRHTSRRRLASVLLVTGLSAACSAAGTEPPAANPAPVADPAPEPAAAAEPEAVERDPSARERWDSPFAVSGTGRAIIREPRDVVVLGADSAIAARLAESSPDALAETSPTRSEDEPRPVSLLGEERESAGRQAASEQRGPATALASSRGDTEDDGDGERSTVGPRIPSDEPEESSAITLHRVEPGDTWSRIVIRYRVTSQALAAANPDVDPNGIRTGQVIRVPPPAASPASRSHRVGPGETLRGIATRYNVTADEIRRINGMRDERVTLGQTLVIPPAGGAAGDGR